MNPLPPDLRALYPWEGRTLAVTGGYRMHYLDVGKGEPLLFVHGNPTWSFYWRHLVAGLSDRFRCIAPDHVGSGLSDKPQDWTYRLEDHVANLCRLVEALDLRGVTLVVHDWGGPIGLGAAVRLPDRIARLVICNTAVFDGPLPLSIRACRLPVLGATLIRGLNGFARAGLLLASADRARMRGAVGRGYLWPYRSWGDRVAHLRFVQDIPLEEGHPSRALFFSIGERVPELLGDRPTLLVWGERDFCFTPAYRETWQRRLPRAEVHALPDAGHWVAEDAHEQIVPLVRDFCERHPLPGSPA